MIDPEPVQQSAAPSAPPAPSAPSLDIADSADNPMPSSLAPTSDNSVTAGRQLYLKVLKLAVLEDRLTQDQEQVLKLIRTEYNLSQADHAQLLAQAGLNEEAFQDLKRNAPTPALCVYCITKSAEYFIVDCRHLCICESCLQAAGDTIKECPICRGRVRKVVRVYT